MLILRFIDSLKGIQPLALTVALLGIPYVGSLSGQNSELPTSSLRLVLGEKTTHKIKSGEKQLFEVYLPEKSTAVVRADQQGADIVLRLLGTDGATVIESNLDRRNDGSETLEFVSEQPGTYRIEARSINDLRDPYSYEIVLSTIGSSTEQDRLLFDARTRTAAAFKLLVSGKSQEALNRYEEAVAAAEKVQGPEGFEVGIALNWLGISQIMLGDLDKSLVSARRALSIFEKLFPAGHMSVIDALTNLGRLEMFGNNYSEAESLYLRAESLSETLYGGDHPEHGSLISNFGVLYSRRADFERAEKMYEKAFEIIARRVAKDDLQLAQPLKNIAFVKFSRGDYSGAAEYDLRAVEICRKSCRQNRLLSYMFASADDYVAGGRGEEAEILLNEILAGYEKLADPSDQDWPNSLITLGRLYVDRGEPEKARPLFAKAISMAEQQGGYGTSPLLRGLLSTGLLQLRAAEFDNADKTLRRGLALAEKAFVPDHPRVLGFVNALSLLNILRNDVTQAITFQQRANRTIEKELVRNLSTGTEQQRMLYLELMTEAFDQSIALDVDRSGGASARELAVSAVLQRKGRVLDALADTASQLSRRSNDEDRRLMDRLRDTNTILARLILDGRGNLDEKAYLAKVDEIQKQKDRLEIDLSRRSSGFMKGPATATTESIRALIPPEAALVEFVSYRPIGSKDSNAADSRLVAYIIRQSGVPGAVALGNTKEIESLISDYRSAARDPDRKDLRIRSRNVYQKIFLPIKKALGDARHLLLSPEGEMNLMPFESLVTESDRFLIEDYDLTYLTGGRDLLRFTQKHESRNNPTVFANPDFGQVSISNDAVATVKSQRSPKRRSVTVTRDLSGTYFAPLRGTAAEADAIAKIFPEAVSHTKSEATEEALKFVSAPRILHIATHGFFVANNNTAWARAKMNNSNPLFLSGLALSGANKRATQGEDGVATALEASGLDLWGTKLVVLSACDTGIGQVRTGEGVFGLRRAFALAGAETLVMSLWPVSDQVTRELMVGFYKNLKQGLSRGESLRRVKLEMLRRPGRSHPFYWASFIQSGEWANLDGKR